MTLNRRQVLATVAGLLAPMTTKLQPVVQTAAKLPERLTVRTIKAVVETTPFPVADITTHNTDATIWTQKTIRAFDVYFTNGKVLRDLTAEQADRWFKLAWIQMTTHQKQIECMKFAGEYRFGPHR